MRVATFNIRDGGGDGRRFADVVAVVTEVAPDVLVIQEATGFAADGAHRLHQLEHATGMRAHLCHAKSGFDVAMLVRRDIEVIRRGSVRRGFRHGCAYADIRLADGGSLRVVGTHLAPFSGQRRLDEVGRLLRRVAVSATVIVMGDLNTLRATADNRSRVEALAKGDRARYLLPDGSGVDGRALEALEAAGLTDLLDAVHPGADIATAPTRSGGGHEFHAMRLDRILGRGAAASSVRAGGVWTEPPADSASDHYLVWCDIALDPVRTPHTVRSMSSGLA